MAGRIVDTPVMGGPVIGLWAGPVTELEGTASHPERIWDQRPGDTPVDGRTNGKHYLPHPLDIVICFSEIDKVFIVWDYDLTASFAHK